MIKLIRGQRHGRIKPARDALVCRRTRRKEGFPALARPFSKDEVKAYFEGDKITCLICGFDFVSLPIHLMRIHGIKQDDYREMYGLPYRRGLCSDILSKKRREIMLSDDARMTHIRNMGFENGGPRAHVQRKPPYALVEAASRIMKQPHKGYEWDSTPIIQDLVSGMSLQDALQKAGVGKTAWFKRLRHDPTLKHDLDTALDAAPFDIQVKHGRLGPSFTATVKELRQAGLTLYAIAKRLGVSYKTVRNHATEPN